MTATNYSYSTGTVAYVQVKHEQCELCFNYQIATNQNYVDLHNTVILPGKSHT